MTRTRCNDRGIALMLALVFVVVLTVLVTSFTYEAQVDATAVSFVDNEFEALLAARSALAEAMSILEADLLLNDTAREEEPSAEIFDSLEDIWAQPPTPTESGETVGQTLISDEFAKINLNALIFEDVGEEKVYFHLEQALRLLFEQREMAVDPVDAILDWLDSDDEPRPNGYESTFYQSLDNPYAAKNGPMDKLEELLLIPGITADVYFGTGETPGTPLPEILTVHGHPQGMVNMNTASSEVLIPLLACTNDPAYPDLEWANEQAELIAQHLEEVGPYPVPPRNLNPEPTPANNPNQNNQDQDQNQNQNKQSRQNQNQNNQNNQNQNNNAPQQLDPANFFDTKSSVFRIQSDAVSGSAQVRLQAYVWRATDEFAGEARGAEAQQMFRVIDWQVIR